MWWNNRWSLLFVIWLTFVLNVLKGKFWVSITTDVKSCAGHSVLHYTIYYTKCQLSTESLQVVFSDSKVSKLNFQNAKTNAGDDCLNWMNTRVAVMWIQYDNVCVVLRPQPCNYRIDPEEKHLQPYDLELERQHRHTQTMLIIFTQLLISFWNSTATICL